MTTKIPTLLCALALTVPGWDSLQAADPAPPAKTGRILILDNGRILEGEVERVGDQYRVRRSIGETWIPSAKVQCLCGTVEEGYEFLRRQANLRDPDERLRLAKWCQLHGLRSLALTEITAAVELRPSHAESRRLWQGLQRSEASPAPAVPKPRETTEPDTAPAVVEYNADALGMFVTRVQPILMNTCASCHSTGKGGAFKLSRAYDGDLLNRRATQQNLAAVLGQVNRDRPQASVILARAVSVHGEAEQPPIKNRQTPAYKLLEEWVQLAMANAPRREGPAPAPAAEPRTFSEVPVAPARSEPATATAPTALPTTSPAPAGPMSSPPVATPAPAAPPAPAPKPAPSAPATPSDPFDPMIFNNQVHPKK